MILTLYKQNSYFMGNSFYFQGFTNGLVNINGKPQKGITFQKNYIYISDDSKHACINTMRKNMDMVCNLEYSKIKLKRTLDLIEKDIKTLND